MIIVGDSSVLIALAQVGKLDLLRQLYGSVTVPAAVWVEVFDRRPSLVPAWVRCQTVPLAWLDRVEAQLDLGEREAIALACELRADLLLIDERRGRVAAVGLGLTITGLVGVLLAAKQRGLLPTVAPIIRELRTGQFWMSDQLVRLALERAGEN